MLMLVQLQKTDNGFLIPVPEDLAQASRFGSDSMVNITLENGRFVVADPNDPYYTIEELLEGMTAENLHEEISTGPPRGNEVW